MKTGRSIQDLALELDVRAKQKKDYVISTDQIGFDVSGDPEQVGPKQHYFDIPGQAIVGLTDHTHGQVASRLKIPRQYYERMRQEAPYLLRDNVQHWFQNNPERRMVRTLGSNARAFLSDRYLRLENEEVAQHVIQSLYEHESQPYPISTEVTDRRLYLKFLFDMEGEVVKGDTIKPGIVITNSEIGQGSYEVRGFFYRDYCTNGCVFGSRDMGVGIRRHHVGQRVEAMEENAFQVFSTQTQKLVHDSLMAQTSDLLTAVGSQTFFDQMLAKLRSATTGEKIINPEQGVEVLAREVGLNDSERSQALIQLVESKDYSRWGAMNAVTAIANNTSDYDRASELEMLGNRILEMDLNRWKQVAHAELAEAA